ncbi:MAG TPA: cation:proton antiporter [Rhizomicrobium sp.]|nr:cation:proton antiporter [Rhizomicrobium sp.]
MPATLDTNIYSDALVVLGTAGVVVPLLRRIGLSPVLGYLGAGALFGPLGLGSLIKIAPPLYWITIGDAHHVEGIAELGVVFLLFLIGLELSFQRLMAMRTLVFGLGSLQVLFCGAAIGGLAVLLGQSAAAAIVLGASLSLSSTAIVLELLGAQNRLAAPVGRASFAVLLAQDIAVIPILMFVSIAGASADGSVLMSVARALGQAAGAIVIIVVGGRFLLRPLFRLVAAARSSDLFIATVLFVIVGAGVIANLAGMSMALGAFVAGLLLAETEYDKAIEAVIEPFKGLLLGLFFFTVGMSIDVRELLRDPLWILAGVAALIAGKALIAAVLGRLFRLSWATSVETALLLGPGGEFAFVGVTLAAGLHVVGPPVATFVLAVVSLTMALTPLLSQLGRRVAPLFVKSEPAAPELGAQPARDEAHAIIIGYGRVGKVVATLLGEHKVPFVATDYDSETVTQDRRAGHNVYFGDASDPQFLQACGLAKATGVIITVNAYDAVDRIVDHVRAERPDILIVARAKDGEHARHLYEVGATDAVPETIEASLQLSEAALVGLGVAMGPAIAAIHAQRDVFRHELQAAALEGGRGGSYATRRKTLRRPPV